MRLLRTNSVTVMRLSCDPRLNGRQSLDLLFHVAELLTDFR